MYTCELCKDEDGMPGEINGLPVFIGIACMRRGKLTETGNLRQRTETWMWKRQVLRMLGASLEDRLAARTHWLKSLKELQAMESLKKTASDARFVQTAHSDLERLMRSVSKGG